SAQPVRVIDSLQRLAEKRDASINRHPSSSAQHRIEGLTAHELHDHEVIIDFAQETMQRGNVGMRELGERNGLSSEPFDNVRLAGKLPPQRLDGNSALEHHVDALVDGSHAAFADFFQDLIVSNYIANHSFTHLSTLRRGPLHTLLRGLLHPGSVNCSPVIWRLHSA